MTVSPQARPTGDAVIWHDVECGAYDGDLRLWEELAEARGGPILELGAGTGRVSLHLAHRGHNVVAVERDPALAAELRRRAEAPQLDVEVVVAAAEALDVGRRFPLALAPMQLLQLLEGSEARHSALVACASSLRPGGLLAAAIIDGVPPEALPPDPDAEGPLPDMREVDGYLYASIPLGVTVAGATIESARRRQIVAPDGQTTEHAHLDRLTLINAAALEDEAEAAGLRPAGRLQIEPTEAHVGSMVLLLEAGR